MKKILVLLFLFALHNSFAQKLTGIFNGDEGMGIFQFSPASNSMELSKPIPSSIGNPDVFWPSICQYEGKIYGRTPIQYEGGNGSIYEYNPTTKTYTLLYDFQYKPINNSRFELVVSKTGLLYGIGSDSISGGYVFELDPTTKVLKKYVTPKVAEYDIINAHYVTIAENNKMYFVVGDTDTENYPISKVIEFDLSSKSYSEKLTTKDIPCMSHTAWDVMSDIGEGKLAGTVNTSGRPITIYIYNYVTNKVVVYTVDGQLYGRSGGPAIRYGTDLYIMASSNKRNGFGAVLKMDIATGKYEEVANYSKLDVYYPTTGCVLNNVLYGYEISNKIISYDFVTKKTSVVRLLKGDGFDAYTGFILSK